MRRGRGWGVKELQFPSVTSPPPPTPYFLHSVSFSSPLSAFGKGKEMAAMQASFPKMICFTEQNNSHFVMFYLCFMLPVCFIYI